MYSDETPIRHQSRHREVPYTYHAPLKVLHALHLHLLGNLWLLLYIVCIVLLEAFDGEAWHSGLVHAHWDALVFGKAGLIQITSSLTHIRVLGIVIPLLQVPLGDVD